MANSSRLDEGIAYAADAMRSDIWVMKFLEDELRKDTPSIEKLKNLWANNWNLINQIIGEEGVDPGNWVWNSEKSFSINETDVMNVTRSLGFQIKCKDFAERYNSVLRTKADWKKRCPRFICTQTSNTNAESITLGTELNIVFK